jgi:4-amino-4-deoxy-L-arabinose transferase-like glycosyltransferase
MAHSLIAILSLLIVLLICSGLGRLILRLLAPKHLSDSEGLLFGVAFGLGAFSYLMMILGLTRLLYPHAALALLVVLALISLRGIRETVEAIASGMRAWKPSGITALAAIPLGLLGLFALIGALAPPSVNDWDTLAYHFAVPALYVKWHAIKYVAFTSHSNLPFLTEMQYTLGLLFPVAGGAALAKLFHLAAGVLTVLTIYVTGKRHFSPLAGTVAALVFASIPLIGWEATAGYIDLSAALYISLAVLALLNHWEEGGGWGLLAAVSLGLAGATKTTTLMFIPMAVVWLVYNDARRGRSLGRGLAQAVGLAMLAGLIASPWYIKSFVHTGNPVYPFMFSVFGGRNWSAHLADVYRASQMKFGVGSGFYSLLLVPWTLTMYSGSFFDWNVVFASIGPVFLVSLPMFAAVRFGRTKLRMLAVFLAASVIAWFYMTQQSRYLIPAMAVGAVAVGALVDELRRFRVARIVLFAAIGIGVAFALCVNGYMASDEAQGLTDSDAYLVRTLDIYPACAYINENLPENAKVVLFADTRGFYCERDYMWGDEIHSTLIPYDRFSNAADMVRFLRGIGVTHALVNFGIGPMRSPNPPKSALLVRQAVTEGLLELQFRSDEGRARNVAVYSLAGK